MKVVFALQRHQLPHTYRMGKKKTQNPTEQQQNPKNQATKKLPPKNQRRTPQVQISLSPNRTQAG